MALVNVEVSLKTGGFEVTVGTEANGVYDAKSYVFSKYGKMFNFIKEVMAPYKPPRKPRTKKQPELEIG